MLSTLLLDCHRDILQKLYGKVSDITRCGGYIFHRIGRADNNIQLGDVAYASIDAVSWENVVSECNDSLSSSQ